MSIIERQAFNTPSSLMCSDKLGVFCAFKSVLWSSYNIFSFHAMSFFFGTEESLHVYLLIFFSLEPFFVWQWSKDDMMFTFQRLHASQFDIHKFMLKTKLMMKFQGRRFFFCVGHFFFLSFGLFPLYLTTVSSLSDAILSSIHDAKFACTLHSASDNHLMWNAVLNLPYATTNVRRHTFTAKATSQKAATVTATTMMLMMMKINLWSSNDCGIRRLLYVQKKNNSEA